MKSFFQKNLRIITAGLITAFSFFICERAQAQGLKSAGSNLQGMQGVGLSSSLTGVTNSVVQGVFYLVGTVFLILTIYGGIVWIKSAGRDEEVARAKRIISTSVIGVVVLLMSYAITLFIMSRLGGT